jgi:voltage-gated potassium channel
MPGAPRPDPPRLAHGAGGELVRRRLIWSAGALAAVAGLGIGGYWLLGGGAWSLADCLYMVVITITTVGYQEALPVASVEGGRAFTMALLVGGMGVSVYALSSLTAFIVEGDLQQVLWRRRMQQRLEELSGHDILCGAGDLGGHVADELLRAGSRPLVVVDRDEGAIARLRERWGDRFFGLVGDATEDRVLLGAGVARAAGLATALPTDHENLFVALSARQHNPKLRVVSLGVDDRASDKLRRAGADVVVTPAHIGGKRMAYELLRPGVIGFIDFMVGFEEQSLDIEEVRLEAQSPLAGKTLANSRIREISTALVLAARDADGRRTYNPPPDFRLTEGMYLIVLGERESIEKLTRYARKP